nr:MAG TPA: hypothetical protein [Caudoviricetes sp.]
MKTGDRHESSRFTGGPRGDRRERDGNDFEGIRDMGGIA